MPSWRCAFPCRPASCGSCFTARSSCNRMRSVSSIFRRPTCCLGMDSDPAKRNVMGVIARYPELARDGIELRKFGLQIIEGLGAGTRSPLLDRARRRECAAVRPQSATGSWRICRQPWRSPNARSASLRARWIPSRKKSSTSAPRPRCMPGMVDAAGNLQLYDGSCASAMPTGEDRRRSTFRRKNMAITLARPASANRI